MTNNSASTSQAHNVDQGSDMSPIWRRQHACPEPTLCMAARRNMQHCAAGLDSLYKEGMPASQRLLLLLLLPHALRGQSCPRSGPPESRQRPWLPGVPR